MYMEIYVHPSLGDDSGYGTSASPYRTVNKAVEEVMRLGEKAAQNEVYTVNIMLGNGVNKIEYPVKIRDLKSNFNISFKPCDDMYTAVSCAKRIDNFAFEYSEKYDAYTCGCSADSKSLYINGIPVPNADGPENMDDNSVFIDSCNNLLIYKPGKNESPQYCVAEIAGAHSMFEIDSCAGISFESVEFTGISSDESSYVSIACGGSVSFKRCRFQNSHARMITLSKEADEISVCDCEIMNISSECMHFGGKADIIVCNNYFDGCKGGILCSDRSGTVKISNNTFVNSALPLFTLHETAGGIIANRIISCAGEFAPLCRGGKVSFFGNCFFSDGKYPTVMSAFTDDVNTMESNSHNVYIETDNKFTYNYIVETVSDNKENRFAYPAKRNREHDNYYITAAKAFDLYETVTNAAAIIKKAGYRKQIKNYGDII